MSRGKPRYFPPDIEQSEQSSGHNDIFENMEQNIIELSQQSCESLVGGGRPLVCARRRLSQSMFTHPNVFMTRRHAGTFDFEGLFLACVRQSQSRLVWWQRTSAADSKGGGRTENGGLTLLSFTNHEPVLCRRGTPKMYLHQVRRMQDKMLHAWSIDYCAPGVLEVEASVQTREAMSTYWHRSRLGTHAHFSYSVACTVGPVVSR
eukprot:2634127-Amphidinium_carterae.2